MKLNFKFLLKSLFLILLVINGSTLSAQTTPDRFPAYSGNDLGVTYSPTETKFRIWAPTASAMVLKVYSDGLGGSASQIDSLKRDISGTWVVSLSGDWKNKFYTLQANVNGKWMDEVADMYAKAVGVNGNRGMIVSLNETNPLGWNTDKKPALKSFNDIILWEIHTRDFSTNPTSGIKNKGKFLAFTEKGTKNPQGDKTGLDHLVDLGVTHIHLLPAFDFRTIDETKLGENNYNWGYDPQNFNVPEGSYSTNPYDGNVRIREFKEMVLALHKSGIRIIMDVVYNHLSNAPASNFEQLVPGYYFRHNPDGSLSNGSGCANETASEQPMMRKFMIESVLYWAKEYHVDGFRFDLMAVHDIETMKEIRAELNKIDPTIFIYGEGWTGGDSPLPVEQRAAKSAASKLDGIAVFSDDIRDGIRGSWSSSSDAGFMCGKVETEESIKFGIVASTNHPQVDFSKVNYSKEAYAANPASTITYVTCHDNPCLWDKISYTCTGEQEKEMLLSQKLANAIVLTSQGVSFLHAGEEVVRTKHGVENSYNSPDSINWIDWSRKSKYPDVYAYYKGLVHLRNNHPAFKTPTAEMISSNLKFFAMPKPLMVGYQISGNANGDAWKNILVYFNGSKSDVQVDLPEGSWRIVGNGNEINEKGLTTQGFEKSLAKTAMVPAKSMLMLVNKESVK